VSERSEELSYDECLRTEVEAMESPCVRGESFVTRLSKPAALGVGYPFQGNEP
jgi:hypothetical protein